MAGSTLLWHRVLLFGTLLAVLASYFFSDALLWMGGRQRGTHNVLLLLSLAWAMAAAAGPMGHLRWSSLGPTDRFLVMLAYLIAVGGGILLGLFWFLHLSGLPGRW